MVFGPYLLVPISAQYCGVVLSGVIFQNFRDIQTFVSIALSLVMIVYHVWIIKRSYATTLVFRPSSFQTIEGAPQVKLFTITIIITFITGFTTYLTKFASLGIAIASILLYFYSITTCFNCGTFIKTSHQVFALGGAILGAVTMGASIYPMIDTAEWGTYIFAVFAGVALIIFVLAYLIIHKRERRDLALLDEIESSNDISMLKKGKFKQLVVTGFKYSHQCCCDFSIFKLAINQWRDSLDIWAEYAKFAAIYPENTSTLLFIMQNVNSIDSRAAISKIVCSNASYIIKTRETKYTPELKSKISKMTKHITKTKNRMRNIWDLILQGSVNEMGNAISNAYNSVKESEIEVNYLRMLYPNNRFVIRNYARFLYDIKGDAIAYKKTVDDVGKLARGFRIVDDIVNTLGLIAFPQIPDYLISSSTTKQNPATETTESFAIEEQQVEDEISLEAIESISKQINGHKIPAIKFIIWSTVICFFLLFLTPLIIEVAIFPVYSKMLRAPVDYMHGMAFCRNLINMIPAFVGKYMMERLVYPGTNETLMNPLGLLKDFPMDAYGNMKNSKDILRYQAQAISTANSQMTLLRH